MTIKKKKFRHISWQRETNFIPLIPRGVCMGYTPLLLPPARSVSRNEEKSKRERAKYGEKGINRKAKRREKKYHGNINADKGG
jgi:hypothetical protein